MDVQTRQFVEALKSLNEATKQVENVATTLLGGGVNLELLKRLLQNLAETQQTEVEILTELVQQSGASLQIQDS